MWLVHLALGVLKIPYSARNEFQLDDFEWSVFVQHRTIHSTDSYDDRWTKQHYDALNANAIFHWHKIHLSWRLLWMMTVFSLDLQRAAMGQRMMHGFYLHAPNPIVRQFL